MTNPLDPRTILLARHAQHVVLIHFPIALFITGVGIDLVSGGRRASRLAGAAYLNLSIAAATILPACGTGLLAWHFVLEGKRLKGVLLLHLVAASVAALLVIACWWIHWRTRRTESLPLPGYRVPIEMLGVCAMALTAHLGGFLSGANQ